ncbi:hypothetical protein, partial [Streptomyces sp. NPDC089915]|uniref:hypothetical protein n=1 Tax=Streptomyces sp. NPDC089915 TaxID=3155186 RepID=UPI00341631AA
MSQPPAEPPAGPPGSPSDRPAGVLGVVRRVARRIDSWLSKPSRAVLLGADDLVVRAPLEDEVWPAGSEQVVAWFVTGPVGPVDIHLVQREGVSTV